MLLDIYCTLGEFGELFVTVVNSASPKSAKVLRYSFRPLSLQLRVHQLSSEELSRPRCFVSFKANSASAAIFHDWVLSLFFDLPPKGLSEDEVETSFHFRNVFTRAITLVSYRANDLRFESESATTIAIIKEYIGQQATSRRVQLQESLSSDIINDQTVRSFLKLVDFA